MENVQTVCESSLTITMCVACINVLFKTSLHLTSAQGALDASQKEVRVIGQIFASCGAAARNTDCTSSFCTPAATMDTEYRGGWRERVIPLFQFQFLSNPPVYILLRLQVSVRARSLQWKVVCEVCHGMVWYAAATRASRTFPMWTTSAPHF